MNKIYDYLIIGAGPAGMAGAIEASKAALSVLVLDQASSAGGQIYRNLGQTKPQQAFVLGNDYLAGRPLLAEFMAANCDYKPQAQVWHIETHEQGFIVSALINGESTTYVASHLLLAHGAMERPMAIPGWHKPGVMTAGAGQILLKSSGLLPKEVVLAGSGPLLLLLAQQYRASGVTIKALLDTTPKANYWRALPWLVAGLTTPKQLIKGLWLTLAQRIKVPYITGVSDLQITGEHSACGVRYTVAGTVHNIACEVIMLHQGLISETQMGQLLGCSQRWSDVKQCWHTQVGAAGQTSVAKIQVAGDAGAVGGGYVAQLQGRIAGLTRAHNAGKIQTRQTKVRLIWLKLRVKQLNWAQGLVERLYQPAKWLSKPSGCTIVCRCEQVSAATITSIASAGCAGVNQLKGFTRAGMGPCQGRQCGLNMGYLVANAQNRPMSKVQPLSVRPPLSPISLGQLAKGTDW